MYLFLLLMLAPGTDIPVEVVAGRSMVWFVIPILAASFLLRPWASFVLFGASCLTIIVVAITGEIPVAPNLFGLLVFFAIALVAWLAAQGLETALVNVRNEEGRRLTVERARADELAVQAQVLEQRVAERTADLARLNEEQLRLIRTLSHNTRNLIQAATTNTEMLLLPTADKSVLHPEHAEYAAQVAVVVNRLTELVSNILDMANLGRGLLVPQFEPVDLAELVRQVVGILQPQADSKQIALQIHVDRPLVTQADPVQMHQVLTNVVGNAIKYTPVGGQVTISSIDDDQIHLVVQDTGAGIPQDELETIFEPLTRAAHTRHMDGHGLGLSITRQLLTLNDGRVWAESPGIGQGTTFHVTVPYREAPELAPEPAQCLEGPAPILIVDDDPQIQAAFATLLG
ncbi:MAG: HAMP domain-containing histidine kinase [Chloroflexi bacterium]|nr:HAMP domain-containing histidine kinase [Chloroflexota bacterium]MBU1750199.1 HAMP domain-containing histidine kinase [Chloroflexota bacterium]